MVELTVLQMVLIGVLVLIVPIGLWNQIRMKKKKEEEENFDYSSASSSGSSDGGELSDAEKSAKTYIEQYKNQYSRESLKSALVNSGNSEADVESWLNKYF